VLAAAPPQMEVTLFFRQSLQRAVVEAVLSMETPVLQVDLVGAAAHPERLVGREIRQAHLRHRVVMEALVAPAEAEVGTAVVVEVQAQQVMLERHQGMGTAGTVLHPLFLALL
jgi:hypothetical protein